MATEAAPVGPTNGTEPRADQALQGEFHGIPISPERPAVARELPPQKLQVEAVILSQTEPSPHRMMESGGAAGGAAGVGTPSITRELPSGRTAPPAGGLPRPGSAGRLSSADAATPRSVSASEQRSLRGVARSPNAAGLQTFGNKFMPFAAGFSNMADTAPVYRSTRLSTINPTAAVTEDTSFYYTLDSGRTEPGEKGEHVRNTRAAAQAGKGGFWGRLSRPIE